LQEGKLVVVDIEEEINVEKNILMHGALIKSKS
jgi:hypothetical protein